MEHSISEEDFGDKLQPSELGTKKYWSDTYEREKSNYQDHGDVGEIWFGEDTELRILRWLQMNVDVKKRVIDLGCGNGMMLLELAREGYTVLTGVDYCDEAIELSSAIIKAHSFDNIELKKVDLTGDIQDLGIHDLVLDKGTYDAVSLNPDNAIVKRKHYIRNIYNLLSNDGFLIITSCNWTEPELIKQFESGFIHFQTIPTPTFKFGGKIGNVVSSVVFKKNKIKH